jgi:hypothetical protein
MHISRVESTLSNVFHPFFQIGCSLNSIAGKIASFAGDFFEALKKELSFDLKVFSYNFYKGAGLAVGIVMGASCALSILSIIRDIFNH